MLKSIIKLMQKATPKASKNRKKAEKKQRKTECFKKMKHFFVVADISTQNDNLLHFYDRCGGIVGNLDNKTEKYAFIFILQKYIKMFA